MKLVVYVMTKTELLDSFLHELQENKIKGATILNSTGMARKLIESDDMNFIGSLKSLFDKPRKESYVILMAVAEEKVPVIYQIIDNVCGSLEEPNMGIVFTLPIDDIKGCNC
ncbi:MAG TPA: hypothetical protein PKU69_03775 [Bacillota bacterium]|nr:hypothetical protein [Bacillota bacterium]HPJ24064.1 hypothetical protein [Bacillota bacterium]